MYIYTYIENSNILNVPYIPLSIFEECNIMKTFSKNSLTYKPFEIELSSFHEKLPEQETIRVFIVPTFKLKDQQITESYIVTATNSSDKWETLQNSDVNKFLIKKSNLKISMKLYTIIVT